MKFSLKYVLALVPILIVFGIIFLLSDIVTYIIIAWIISMMGAPIVVKLRKYVGKDIAAIFTLALFILGFIILIWTFFPPLVNQIENLSKVDYNKVANALEEPIKDWEKWLVNKKLIIQEDTNKMVVANPIIDNQSTISHKISIDSTVFPDYKSNSFPLKLEITLNQKLEEKTSIVEENQNDKANFFDILKNNINTYLNPEKLKIIFNEAVNAFGNMMVALFSIFFIGFFFLREQGLFDAMLISLVPREYEIQTKQAVDETSTLLIRYFIGILLQVFLITFLIAVPLALFGVKNALLIGSFAGLMNVIPYIGPIIAAFTGALITLSGNIELSFYDQMIPLLFKVMGVFFVVRLIDDFVLQPNIFSKSVKAHPLEIFIIVMVGAKLGGVLGMVLAIPFYTAFRVIGKVFLSEFKIIQKLTKNI